MSYTDHYGLTAAPFQLTPDPRFWFESTTHKRAMAYLGYGLQQGEGFIVVTGEIGAGKTTLVGLLMERVDPARVAAVRIVSTQVDGDDMLRLAAQGFGLPTEGVAKAQLLDRVERYLIDRAREGRKTLLIVDEAQNLSTSALEELRMLSNFQAGGRSLLQILLLGQPEFRERLASPALEQLRQRVIATHHLDAMQAEETRGYLEHRLGVVGWTGRPRFDEAACQALHVASGGVPRRLNQFAMRALLMGAIENRDAIDKALIDEVVADYGVDHATPDPIDVPAQPEVAPPAFVSPEPEPVVAGEPISAPAIATASVEAIPDPRLFDHDARIAMLEARVAEQEAALRRVLTLLIDWVEREEERTSDFARARPA